MSYTTTTDNGNPDNRIDLVILGDGYRSSDFTTLESHADTLVDYLFTSGGTLTFPFGHYEKFFNVHLVYTASAQSGTDDPTNGISKNTAFDTTFSFGGGPDRLLYGSESKASAVLSTEFGGTAIDPEMLFMTVNTTKYGGGGGMIGVYSGGNTSALEVALHEIGHSFADLADEYGGFTSTYTGSEPTEANVTIDGTGAKWSHWLGYDQPGIGVIGAYDGGRYYDSGIYRPSDASKMKVLGNPFDVVSIEQFILKFYGLVDPLDSWTSNAGVVRDQKMLVVDPIDPGVIDVEWTVDGTLSGLGDVVKLNLTKLGKAPGTTVTVDARAYDPTEFVRIDLSELEMTITWEAEIPYYVNKIFGTGKADRLKGVAWDDKIVGRGGDDLLLGIGGKDRLLGQDGSDVLKGGAGHDKLFGGNGSDELMGNGGKDRLFGGKGADILGGGGGKDHLDGGDNADRLLGNGGNDILTGGKGADRFDFAAKGKMGDNRITDFENGIDQMIMPTALSFADLTVTKHTDGTLVTWSNGSVILEGITKDQIDAGDFIF